MGRSGGLSLDGRLSRGYDATVSTVWIVVEEGEFGDDISGVFESQEAAALYAEATSAEHSVQTRYSSFTVPYRLRDRSTLVEISDD